MYSYNNKLIYIILIIIIFYIFYTNCSRENFINNVETDWNVDNVLYSSSRENNYYKFNNIDYPNNNIKISKEDIIDCARKCNDNDNCVGFTSINNNICNLKNKLEGKGIFNKNSVTYKRTEDKTNINFEPNQNKYVFINKLVWNDPKNNLLTFKDNSRKCNIKCNLDPKYVGYNINNDKTCELKNKMEGKGTISNNTMGSY